jgi:hypothetical protein
MNATIEIYFKYKKKKAIPIESEASDKFKDICEKYAENQSLNIKNIIFIYEGEKINLNTQLLVWQQFHLDKLEKTKIEIKVCEDIPFHIKF